MSDDKPLDFYPGTTTYFNVFDNAINPKGFSGRFDDLAPLIEGPNVRVVPHNICACLEDLEKAEAFFLEAGFEGLMYRDPDGIYKHGRSSEREQILLKVKRFKDAEATIVACYEEQENQNESFKNELGRTARSSAKAGKTGKGQLGGFHCVGVAGGEYAGVEFDVSSSSITHDLRRAYWAGRDNYLGKLIVYKYFPTGGDTRPRHPVFKGFRDVRDL
jgi:DNA ligase-1